MARRAFLLGRNTGKLRYCAAYDEQGQLKRSDLWLMQDCLDRVLGFDQVETASCGATYDEILDQLEAVTGSCIPEDIFVFYYAGHSWGRDGLQLVIADDYRKRRNWMPATQIVGFVKDCPALCKLMILDSCEAGKVANGLLPDPGSNIRILTATDGIFLAQERERLEAGVFTFHLCEALTDETLRHPGPNGVLDELGNLCLERVHRRLKNTVPGYALPEEPKIPEPHLYGGAGKEIFFATDLEPYRQRSFTTEEVRELLALLGDADLADRHKEELYEDVLTKSGLRGGDYLGLAPKLSAGSLGEAIEFLARVGKLSGADIEVPVPLLELVARLADAAANGEAIRKWCDATAEKLQDKEFTRAHIAALGYTRDSPRQALSARYLLIAFELIDRNPEQVCTAGAWLVDAQGNGGQVAKRPEVRPDQFARFIAESLGHDRVQDYLRGAHERLSIELMLPVALLDAEHDECTPEGYATPLSTQYPLMLRPVERHPTFNTPLYTAGWGACWHACAACRCAPAAATCTAWLQGPPPEGFLDLIEDQDMCLFALCYQPHAQDLGEMLDDGVAMALWPSRPLPEMVYEELRRWVEDQPLDTLPNALRKIRRRQWRRARAAPDAEPQSAGVRLLWDDPQRVPKRYGKERKTGRVVRAHNPMRAR